MAQTIIVDANIAVSQILALPYSALAWAERLNRYFACAAHTLALADNLGAEFWTADRSLARQAVRAGFPAIHKIGE
jgi:predicted nucleic acid-binding protein